MQRNGHLSPEIFRGAVSSNEVEHATQPGCLMQNQQHDSNTTYNNKTCIISVPRSKKNDASRQLTAAKAWLLLRPEKDRKGSRFRYAIACMIVYRPSSSRIATEPLIISKTCVSVFRVRKSGMLI